MNDKSWNLSGVATIRNERSRTQSRIQHLRPSVVCFESRLWGLVGLDIFDPGQEERTFGLAIRLQSVQRHMVRLRSGGSGLLAEGPQCVPQ